MSECHFVVRPGRRYSRHRTRTPTRVRAPISRCLRLQRPPPARSICSSSKSTSSFNRYTNSVSHALMNQVRVRQRSQPADPSWPRGHHGSRRRPILRRDRLMSEGQRPRTSLPREYKGRGGQAGGRMCLSVVAPISFTPRNALLPSFRHPPCCCHLRHHRARLVPPHVHHSARERARRPDRQPWSVPPRDPRLRARLNQPSRRRDPVPACAHHPRWLRLQPELYVQRPARVLVL
jgi:hypothetical protein